MSEFQLCVAQNLENFAKNFIQCPSDRNILQALEAKLKEYNKRTETDYNRRAPERAWHHFAKVFILKELLETMQNLNELEMYNRFKAEVGEQIFDFTKDGVELVFMDKFHGYFYIIKTYAENSGKGLWGGTGLQID